MTDKTRIGFRTVGQVTVADIQAGELTAEAAEQLQGKVRELSEAGSGVRLVLDLSGVRFMNSVALGMLVVLLRRVRAAEGQLALAGLSGHALRILQVTGLEKVFNLHDNVDRAVEELAGKENRV